MIFSSLIFNLFEKVTPQSGQVYGDSAGGYGAPSDSYGGGGGGGGASYAAPSSSYDARSSYDYRTVSCQIFNCQQSRCLDVWDCVAHHLLTAICQRRAVPLLEVWRGGYNVADFPAVFL